MTKTETTEARERPVDFYEQFRAAGVDQALIGKILDHVDTERAKATAKAARLFYRSEDGPIPAVQFSDELNTMARRLWGLVAAASDLVEGHDDPLSRGVLQLAEDASCGMDRLAEAFEAERWLARGTEEPHS